MTQKPRRDRRAEILETFIRVADAEGFAAATVRRIASDLKIAVGGIHYIFNSSAELKREAFRCFAEQQFDSMDDHATGSPVDQLIAHLCVPEAGSSGIFLWREAADEAARDAVFADVYSDAIGAWHDRIVQLLEEAGANAPDRTQIEAAAWRLMAISSGFAGMSRVPPLQREINSGVDMMREAITMELQAIPGASLISRSAILTDVGTRVSPSEGTSELA